MTDDELLDLETAAIQSIDGELRGPALKVAARIRELKTENHHLKNSAELMRKELIGVYAETHVIVPVEPTEAMKRAALDYTDMPLKCWSAYISAAQPGASD